MASDPSKPSSPRILVDRVSDGAALPGNILHVPPRMPDAPDRIDRRPRVSDDPRVAATVRRLWEEEIDRLYRTALERARAGKHIWLEQKRALRERREQAVADLRAVVGGEGGSDPARARAAGALCDLGDAEGERLLLEALESPSTSLRRSTLEMLNEPGLRIDLARPPWPERILTQLDHPDAGVVKAAAHLCTWKDIPGAEQALASLLSSGRAADPQQAALNLARIATTPDSVQALLPHLFRAPPRHYNGYHVYFAQVLRHPDPRVSEPARAALHGHAAGLTRSLEHQQHVVRDLALTADASAVPLLEEVRDQAKDPASRLYALEALARLRPGQAVDLVLDFMARDRRYHMAIDTLAKHATEQDADRILAALELSADADLSARLNASVVNLLLTRLGEKGRRLIADHLDQVAPEARMQAVWALRGLSVPGALADLHQAGVLTQTPEEMLARMSPPSEDADRPPLDLNSPHGLLNALADAGLVTMFDTETSTIPCDHHWLILNFAEGTTGRFRPECPAQVWHRQDENDFNAPYTVAFVHRGRVYYFGAENYGDYYDVEAVVGALNFALADAGQPGRFLGIDGMGQCALYVFADPAAFLPVAAKYGIPISADPSGPMRAGRAFEERVLEGQGGEGEKH